MLNDHHPTNVLITNEGQQLLHRSTEHCLINLASTFTFKASPSS